MLLDAIGNDQLDSVDGVGPKTAENIEKALTL
jgi:DNA uptake protein ComE-like DNA-binding protein